MGEKWPNLVTLKECIISANFRPFRGDGGTAHLKRDGTDPICNMFTVNVKIPVIT
jgi:hypothetical protein